MCKVKPCIYFFRGSVSARREEGQLPPLSFTDARVKDLRYLTRVAAVGRNQQRNRWRWMPRETTLASGVGDFIPR